MAIGRGSTGAAILLLLAAIYLLGPVATSLVQAARYSSAILGLPEQERHTARRANARRLLDLFDARHPVRAFSDPDKMPGDECGYSPGLLEAAPRVRLPDGRKRPSVAVNGYWYLVEASLARQERQAADLRADALAKELGDFRLSLLSNCINRTIFADQCEARIGNMLAHLGMRDPRDASGSQGGPVNDRVESDVMCSYLDGVAARRGFRLAPH